MSMWTAIAVISIAAIFGGAALPRALARAWGAEFDPEPSAD